ncbi:hypothetical protein OAG20_02900 [Verrucomicrobiales bacterium]|nr:hypothetical protein [Verrucomicrobiales bacterium]
MPSRKGQRQGAYDHFWHCVRLCIDSNHHMEINNTDLVETYFSVIANTPLKAIIFYLMLAFGAASPG